MIQPSQDSYCIKPAYRLNLDEQGAQLGVYTEAPPDMVYQIAVYRWASELVRRFGAQSVLELGYGSGHKLLKYVFPVCSDITGVDAPHSLEYASRHHKVGTWLADDFDDTESPVARRFDFILSVDVIEHLRRPDNLLKKIKAYANPGARVLISTPERTRLYGEDMNGPPGNKLHIREWTQSEFQQFLLREGFDVEEHRILPAFQPQMVFQRIKQAVLRRDLTCQAALCRLR